MNVLCHVSGHGYGHLTRTIALINALTDADCGVSVHVRTTAPRWLLDVSARGSVSRHEASIDAGVLELGPQRQDAEATLARYAEMMGRRGEIIEQETAWCADNRISIIVSDIPPLASAIGAAAGIPVVAVGNFSWDYIYRPWLLAFPRYAGLIRRIREDYGKTSLLLRLPLAHVMDAFPRQRDIPLVARRRAWPAGEGRRRLGIPDDETRPLVLVALRMGNHLAGPVNRLAAGGEHLVLTFDDRGLEPSDNLRVLPPGLQSSFPDVLATADVLISKLGYSMCAEAIAGRTPVLFIPRYDYHEHKILAAGIVRHVPASALPRAADRGDTWPHLLRRLLAAPIPPAPPVNGAEVAARIILQMGTAT